MVIYPINFPIYKIIIALSVIIGALYVYISLKNEKMNKKNILIFFIMYFVFAITFGKLYTMIATTDNRDFFTVSLSAYGGLIGVLIAAIIYSKIYQEKYVVKYTILSLPLIYSFTKIGCFITGCCRGIPYDGIFSVTYPLIINKPLFPIQLLEVIIFNIIFQICNRYNTNKNISYITLILIAIVKFLVEYLRDGHIKGTISPNQIFSIILFTITIIIYLYNKKKETN